jgi:hypothetical protein
MPFCSSRLLVTLIVAVYRLQVKKLLKDNPPLVAKYEQTLLGQLVAAQPCIACRPACRFRAPWRHTTR